MAIIKNLVNKGTVNTDVDERLTPNGELLSAKNVEFVENGNDGVATNLKGNVLKKDGGWFETYEGKTVWGDKIYLFYFHTTSLTHKIVEYDTSTDTYATVLSGDFNGNTQVLIEADVIDGKYLYWTDYTINSSDGSKTGVNHPKRINIEDAKADPTGYFSSHDINNILPRPNAPTVIGVKTTSDGATETLKIDSYSFALRFKTKYNEYTPLGYKSETFNQSIMLPAFPTYALTIEWSSALALSVSDEVTEVEVYVYRNLTNKFYRVHKEDIIDSNTHSVTINDFSYQNILDSGNSNIINYNTPRLATTQELAGNRLVYANIENRLPDWDDKNKHIDYTRTESINLAMSTVTGTITGGTVTLVGVVPSLNHINSLIGTSAQGTAGNVRTFRITSIATGLHYSFDFNVVKVFSDAQ